MSARNTNALIEKQDVNTNFTTSDTSNNVENQTYISCPKVTYIAKVAIFLHKVSRLK